MYVLYIVVGIVSVEWEISADENYAVFEYGSDKLRLFIGLDVDRYIIG